MRADIVIVNAKRGMVAAREHDENTWVILEILEHELPEMGDTVEHPDFETMGKETYRNVTQSVDFEVCVQNVVWSESAARERCFLPPKSK